MKDTKEFLENAIKSIKVRVANSGGHITENEIAEKAGISNEQLNGYLEGNQKLPDGFVFKLLSAYNIERKMVQIVHEIEIDWDEDDSPDEEDKDNH